MAPKFLFKETKNSAWPGFFYAPGFITITGVVIKKGDLAVTLFLKR
jgi:hypothetical protein